MPQCGRASSAASTCTSAASTAAWSRTHVKWKATVSRSYIGLIHSRSAAIVRISHTCRTGRRTVRRCRAARRSRPARARAAAGTRSGSPRRWRAESPCGSAGGAPTTGPGTPSCGVVLAGIEAEDHVALGGRRAGVEELGDVVAALHPHRVQRRAEARDDADAVTGAGDGVEVLAERVPREPFEDPLAQLERGLDVERDARDDAERAEVHDRALEVGVAALEPSQLAVGGQQLERAHRRGEVAVGVAGPVRGGRDRARHRDVRERGEVVQGEAAAVELDRQLAVREAGAEADRRRRRPRCPPATRAARPARRRRRSR